MKALSPYLTLSEAIVALKSGNVIGMPTETVYGLAADIMQEQAVKKIFSYKNRPINHPLIIHIADLAQLEEYALEIPPYAKALARIFWPGPLTLVLRKSQRVGEWVTGGQDTVGVRIPNHPLALALIREMKVPLAAPSANQFGKISPTTAEHVIEEFNGLVRSLDGGPCAIGIESTIILATDPKCCTLLRPGMISIDSVRAVVGSRVTVKEVPSENIRVSGNLDSHYAPSKPTFLCYSTEEWERLKAQYANQIYTIYYSTGFEQCLSVEMLKERLSSDPNRYAQQIYASLRTADHSCAKVIVLEAPRSDIAWVAIGDRLKKSTAKGLLLDIAQDSR